MNVNAVASRFFAEKPAGKSVPSAASQSSAAIQSSTVVTLSGGSSAEAVTYSGKPTASGLLDRAKLLLPTRENAAMLAAKAGDEIAAKLDAAGIPRNPGFSVEIEDVNSAHVTIKGNRADAKAIEDLINGDPSLQMDIHNAYALASSIPAMERSAAFSRDYMAAQSDAEIKAVIARYSDLFSGFTPKAEVAMQFGNGGLLLSVNGEQMSGQS